MALHPHGSNGSGVPSSGLTDAGKALAMLHNRFVIDTHKAVHYEVVLADDLFTWDNELLLRGATEGRAKPPRCLMVIDQAVERLYGDTIRQYFTHHRVEARLVPIPASESEKTMAQVLRIARALDEFHLARRGEPIVGMGGGVLRDIVGLAANLYRRGVPYAYVPTTLVGLIDAGIGVKTGVNFNAHKNRLGTYYPPTAVYLDRTFLNTLDNRHLANGLAEILKLALVKDATLFALLEQHAPSMLPDKLQGSAYDAIFQRAIAGMLEELAPNLWEDTLERLVDYGHTFSPAIEMQALPALLHGEAVAIDMAFSLVLAEQRGLMSRADRDRVLRLLRQLNLPLTTPLATAAFLSEALQDTTVHRDGQQRLPLTLGIGSAAFFNDVTYTEIAHAARGLAKVAAAWP